ncbi:Low_molecular weight protein-tyrosine-phosphatase [Hexamita inflata]|uniref:Low_molecular weight protein-tyrosine-phosphatase n=1 Tax=Hexamita inflata TaxID=28002 RepID=A0ABP1K2S7_9EUKA
MKPGVLFVCLGNICRSPLAHGVMQHLLKQEGNTRFGAIDSCGMYGEPEGEPTHRGSVAVIKQKLGVSFSKGSRHWRKSDYEKFDLILTMDRSNFRDVMDELQNQDPLKKVKMFRDFDPAGQGDVPDPYYTGGFDGVYKMVERTCRNLIDLHAQGKLLQ